MTHVTCRLTAKNRDQLRNPTLGNRVWATFTFFMSMFETIRIRRVERCGPPGGANVALYDDWHQLLLFRRI